MDLSLVPGQVVWAKLGGFPWWPASVKRVVSPNLVEVEYFGEFERNFFDLSRIRLFENPPEKINRRNSKLLDSHAQAFRVNSGQSTVDQEKIRFFGKKFETVSHRPSLKRSVTHQDLSTHYSTVPPTGLFEAVGEAEGVDAGVNESFVEGNPGLVVERFIKGQIKTAEKSKGVLPVQSTKRRKRIAKQSKQDELLALTRHFSLPVDTFRRRASLPHFDHLIFCGEYSNDTEAGKDQLNRTERDHSGDNGDRRETSRSPKDTRQDLSEAKIVENALRDILAALHKERPQPVECQSRLVTWMKDFRQTELHIDKLFQTQIGELLVELVARCAALSAKPVFRELHAASLDILNTIQGSLVSNFFKVDPFQSRSDLPIGQTTHILTHKKDFDSAENTQAHSLAFPQSSNSALTNCNDPQNGLSFLEGSRQSAPGQSGSLGIEAKENEAVQGVSEDDAFKVSKKLARLLFEKVVNGRKTRAECESLANQIEGRIRAISKTREEYQRKWVYLFHRISFNSEKFLSSFKEVSPAVGELPIMDLVQALIIKK